MHIKGMQIEIAGWNEPKAANDVKQRYARTAYQRTIKMQLYTQRFIWNLRLLYMKMLAKAITALSTYTTAKGDVKKLLVPSSFATYQLYTLSPTPIPKGSILPIGSIAPTIDNITTAKRKSVCLRCIMLSLESVVQHP